MENTYSSRLLEGIKRVDFSNIFQYHFSHRSKYYYQESCRQLKRNKWRRTWPPEAPKTLKIKFPKIKFPKRSEVLLLLLWLLLLFP